MKLRVFLCIFLLTIGIPQKSFAAPTDEQQKLLEIQKKLEESKKKLDETKQKEQQALSKLVVTKKKLVVTQKNLNQANTKIMLNQGQIQKLSVDIKETSETLDTKARILSSRVKEIYKNSSVNYLELLFSSTSMSDFINRFYFFSKIVERDTGLIQGITKDYYALSRDKKVLTEKTDQIKELATEIAQEKQEISKQADSMNELYGDLQGRRARYEKEVAEFEKSSAELEKVIISKIAERRKQNVAVTGNTGSFDWPLRGRITSVFGPRRNPFWRGTHMHTGIDIAAPYGETIKAGDGGDVIFAGWWDGYGKAIVIDHGKNISSVYGHMSRLYVQVGNSVKKGQIIGLVGSTGYSTGPHLHFEVRVKGKPQNPYGYLP
ncbi:peptidoglycan DD-metalloendopeptidase family protein [Candidatus Saganbacteria bacterium]|uniref:Peptidoglycan DD-metalloendopeptidase family protein n=1 Tax=Candidatus Saganbacteria bacterium TaxID=2575572 RepID=A0A9D6UM60_UNCSA|nr:peptidoglycan DD-metalloendopeptidase family protein [Candidatus Saganbacteria bacterium]